MGYYNPAWAAAQQERTQRYEKFAKVYAEAHDAGMKAGNEFAARPMVVSGHGQSYFVADGVCGFSWVVIKPATSSFAKWLVKTAKVPRGRSYGGGIHIWCSEFNQSMQRKEAYTTAFAKVLNDNGIKCYSASRMD